MDKLIKAEDIFIAIRDDIEISGTNFARVVDHLKNMKPVDAVPVVHGQWIHTTIEDDDWGGTWHKWTCSNCSFSTGNNPTRTNYCPCCGTLMDGDKHE